jgi:hypothetical protein
MAPECFADEVAVDFPSVGDAIERMCDRFLGKAVDHDVLTSVLHLSPREASHGLTVPFDVPVRGPCPLCGGRGETWAEPCNGCRGTGAWLFHHPVRLSVPPGVCDGARFRFRVTSRQAASVRVEVRIAVGPLPA